MEKTWEIINSLEEQVDKIFSNDGTGHDLYHLKRVTNLALTIQEKEGGDRLIIGVSSFLHDIHRIIQNETKKYCSPKDSLPQVKTLLDTTSLSEPQKQNILHCIEFHEEYYFSEDGKTVNDLETLILQDADNLDAIGAVGITRVFMFHGANGDKLWNPEVPFDREFFDETKKDETPIHHFKHKLLKLKDNMNTATGKKMAQNRHEFMEQFLEEFFAEWEGKK